MAMAIMWSLTVVTWVFVILRTYTRAVLVRHVGADDYVYVFSGVSLPAAGCVTRLPADMTCLAVHAPLLYSFSPSIVNIRIRPACRRARARQRRPRGRMGDDWADVCRHRHGHGQGVYGPLPSPNCGSELAQDSLVDCVHTHPGRVGGRRRLVLDPVHTYSTSLRPSCFGNMRLWDCPFLHPARR